MYQSDNQTNVYYSQVRLGQQPLAVTTIYGTSNYVLFTALTGDPTPSITSISPNVWPAGATTEFTISGTGFGTNPGLTIDSAWVENYGVYRGWDTGMHAWVTVSPDTPNQQVTVTVTSNEYLGQPFLPQYPNQPNYGSATVTLLQVVRPATLSLDRSSLTQIWGYGYPTPVGACSWSLNLSSGNAPFLQYAAGITAQTHPNPVQVVAPARGGTPTPGGISQYTAQYQAASGQTSPSKSFKLATLGVSCYMIADEYDFWNGQNYGTLTWDGVVYSGTTLNPPNVTGTYCTAFLADTRLQGSGVARDSRKIKYNLNTGQYYTVSQFTGSDGSLVVADQTVARDPAIIPTGGVHVDLQGLGDGLLANDTGSRITGYRIDLFRGQGHAVCDGWPNPIVVGTCSPGNSNCPPRSVE